MGKHSKTTFDGKVVNAAFIRQLGYMFGKCLRHSEILPTTSAAFAWSDDLLWTVWQDPKTYPNLGRKATLGELCLAVENTEGRRFQISFLDDTFGPYTVMIRCVQGHTKAIADRIVRTDAYVEAVSPTTPVHYTAQEFLRTITGPGEFGRGLVPGGLDKRANKGPTSTCRRRSRCPTVRCLIAS